MFAKRSGILALVLVGSLGVPAVALAAPTLTVGAIGQVGPEGTTVTVPVTYSCDPPLFGGGSTIGITIAESTGNNKLVQGSGYGGTTCDGTVYSTTVVVDVGPTASIPFKPGTATLSAFLMAGFGGTDPVINLGPQPLKLKK